MSPKKPHKYLSKCAGVWTARHHKWLAIGNRASVNVEPCGEIKSFKNNLMTVHVPSKSNVPSLWPCDLWRSFLVNWVQPHNMISILYKFHIDIFSNSRELKYQNIGRTHTQTVRHTDTHTDRQTGWKQYLATPSGGKVTRNIIQLSNYPIGPPHEIHNNFVKTIFSKIMSTNTNQLFVYKNTKQQIQHTYLIIQSALMIVNKHVCNLQW